MSCQAFKKKLFTKYIGTKRPRTIEPEIHWGQVVEAIVPWRASHRLMVGKGAGVPRLNEMWFPRFKANVNIQSWYVAINWLWLHMQPNLIHCLAETQGLERLKTCSAVGHFQTLHVGKLPKVSSTWSYMQYLSCNMTLHYDSMLSIYRPVLLSSSSKERIVCDEGDLHTLRLLVQPRMGSCDLATAPLTSRNHIHITLKRQGKQQTHINIMAI